MKMYEVFYEEFVIIYCVRDQEEHEIEFKGIGLK